MPDGGDPEDRGPRSAGSCARDPSTDRRGTVFGGTPRCQKGQRRPRRRTWKDAARPWTSPAHLRPRYLPPCDGSRRGGRGGQGQPTRRAASGRRGLDNATSAAAAGRWRLWPPPRRRHRAALLALALAHFDHLNPKVRDAVVHGVPPRSFFDSFHLCDASRHLM